MNNSKPINGRVAIWALVFAMVVNVIGVVWLISKVDTKAQMAYDFVVENRFLPIKVQGNEKSVAELTSIRVQLADINTKLALFEYKLDKILK